MPSRETVVAEIAPAVTVANLFPGLEVHVADEKDDQADDEVLPESQAWVLAGALQEIAAAEKVDIQEQLLQSNKDLLDSARRMDREALINIFDQYAPAIYSYTLRLIGNQIEADNVVGDVFAKLLEQLAVGSGPRTNLRSYLYQAAYHLVVDRARNLHRNAPLEVAESLAVANSGSHIPVEVETKIMLELVRQVIDTELSEDQRHVIILRFLEGFSLKETAAIIKKKVGNVKVIQNRALKQIRDSIGLVEEEVL